MEHLPQSTMRGLRRNQRNLTAKGAKFTKMERILFLFSAFLWGKNLPSPGRPVPK